MSVGEVNISLKDDHNLVYYLFYLTGAMAMLPLGLISNAQTYWKFKFRDTNESWDTAREDITALQKEFTAVFAAITIIFTYSSVALSARFTRKWNLMYRINGGFVFMILILGVFLLLANVDTDNWQTLFLYLSIILFALIAICTGFVTFALFQMSSRFPPKYLASTIAGESLAGVFSSSLQILTLIVNSVPVSSATLNFGLGMFLVFSTLVTFILFIRWFPFLKYHLSDARKEEDKEEPIKINMSLIKTVFKHQKYILIALCLVSGGAAIIQPGITATVQSVNVANGSMLTGNLFVPIVVYLMYNIVDIVGRQLAITINKPKDNIAVLIISAARLILIPLILMCHLLVKAHTPVIFKSDTVFIIFIALLAFSSGYLTNMIILGMSRNYTNPRIEKDTTIGVLVGFTFLSSSAGNLLAIVLTKIL